MQEESDDEIEIFARKIKALNNVAANLNDVINSQNGKLRGITPQMSSAFGRLQNMVRRVAKSDNRKFRGWLYFIGGTILIFFLILIFFIFS